MIGYDTESEYSAGHDINSLGVDQYVRHPKTNAYLVSLYGEGIEYAGPPENAPWDKVAGKEWCSHNRSFDSAIHAELVRRGKAPAWAQPKGWECTADLCAYLQAPRALAKAMVPLCGIELSKAVRDRMKGQTWATMTPEFKQEAIDYALDDSRACYMLWEQYGHLWPQWERDLSKHTTLMTSRGIGLDMEKVEDGIETLKQAMFAAEAEIPWVDDVTGPAARKALAEQCRKVGVPPPASTAKNSPEFEAWVEQYGDQAPFISALRDWRQTKRLLDVFQAFKTRSRDSVLPYSLRYFGAAHTGRWSGDSGLNLQNLARDPLVSKYAKGKAVYSRECLMAPEGYTFVGADLAQIEPRVILWLAGDTAALEPIRGGQCLYEVHARRFKGYSDPRPLKEVAETNKAMKALRQLCKAEYLGLGYGMGASRFISTAKAQLGMDIGAAEADNIVKSFRKANKGITDLWSLLGAKICRPGRQSMELPSGRIIRYFDVFNDSENWRGRVERGGPAVKLYGGHLTENLTQATARDVIADSILKVERAGMPVVLHVHDEIVTCVREEDAKDALRELTRIMSTSPEWAPDLPVGVESKISKRYWK